MTAEEFIAQLKAEREDDITTIKNVMERMNRPITSYEYGYYLGQLRFDKDVLEKIEEWEKQK